MKSVASLKATNTEVSIVSSVASAVGLKSLDKVTIRRVHDIVTVSLTHAELTLRDGFISRAGMWRLKSSLSRRAVVVGEEVTFGAARIVVKECSMGPRAVMSGMITLDTKLVFRSRAARYFLLVQLSKEMWDFADDGDMCAARAIRFCISRAGRPITHDIVQTALRHVTEFIRICLSRMGRPFDICIPLCVTGRCAQVL